jgi:glutamate dehydrogenase
MLGKIPAARQEIIDRIATRARRAARGRTPVPADRFARYFFNGVSELDLVQRADSDLAGAAILQLTMGRVRRPGRPIVRVFNPDPTRDGFASSHTVIAVITDDMPFLVDSIGIVCTQERLAIHLIAHPVFGVVRDRRGRLTDLFQDDARPDAKPESWQIIEVDREADPARLAALERRIKSTLEDVRLATTDWHPMRRMAREIAADLGKRMRGPQASEMHEVKALLEWMEERHFAFLGYREYRLRRGRQCDR